MKYEVIATNWGFKNRYWEKGEIVEIDPSEKPNKWFRPLNPIKEGNRISPELKPESTPKNKNRG